MVIVGTHRGTWRLMGLLSQGKPLSWEDANEQAEYVRDQGIQQFLSQYAKYKDRHGDNLKWGDEVFQ